MKSNSKWIQAGKSLSSNSTNKVICPECEKINLKVIDYENPENSDEIERLIYCSYCGAKNYIRQKKNR